MRSALLLFALLAACGGNLNVGDDDDTPDPTPTPEPHLPDEVPPAWVDALAGSVTYERSYTSGVLAGQVCTEQFTLDGANITGIEPDPCKNCDVLYSMFMTQVDGTDCAGGDDLLDEGRIGFLFDFDQDTATLWYWNEGLFGWGEGWSEVAPGELVVNETDLRLEIGIDWADPNNGSFGNSTSEGDCEFLDPCRFDGQYRFDFQLGLDENLIEWEQ